MGRAHPGLARGTYQLTWSSFHCISKSRFLFYEIGDTSLPPERPEMLDDDLLKQLHHVLLEVCQIASSLPSPP